MKNLIPLQGVTNNGMSFFFHGQECYVKANDWDIELEFGPKGEIRALKNIGFIICLAIRLTSAMT